MPLQTKYELRVNIVMVSYLIHTFVSLFFSPCVSTFIITTWQIIHFFLFSFEFNFLCVCVVDSVDCRFHSNCAEIEFTNKRNPLFAYYIYFASLNFSSYAYSIYPNGQKKIDKFQFLYTIIIACISLFHSFSHVSIYVYHC